MEPAWHTIEPLGDSALRIECGELADSATADRVTRIAAALRAGIGTMIHDVVPAWTTVVVHYDAEQMLSERPRESPFGRIKSWVEMTLSAMPSSAACTPQPEVVVPVVYGGSHGPDLEHVARQSGLSCDEVIATHTSGSYRVRAVGFTPGFAYLEGLAPPLATPRRPSPRTQVPGGSVGIGGTQTGIYPLASPGGWNLIGQTPSVLFDPARHPPCSLEVGQRVRFVDASAKCFRLPANQGSEHPIRERHLAGPKVAEVVDPGIQTLLQAEPRWGAQQWGITPGGNMVDMAARVANLVVGNSPDAPVVEAALRGPKLRWRCNVVVAIKGHIEGVPTGRPLKFAKGDELDLTRLRGARCYLAIAGGFAAQRDLGGQGTHLQLGVGGFHGRPLQKGDVLQLAATLRGAQANCREGGAWFVDSARLMNDHATGDIRILRGPQCDWFSPEAWNRLVSTAYRISPRSDRMGIRLEGEPITLDLRRDMVSEGVVTGAIQVPPDGQPIILGVDRQTIGGYPMIACVATVDWDRLAQLPPGSHVKFREISHTEAEALLARRLRNWTLLRAGLACHD